MTLILFNKPFDVLSQFTDKGTEGSERSTLSDYIPVPKVYPAGRLDRDSEGLMLLTDDGRLQMRITEPRYKTKKTYLAQVEGIATEEALEKLRRGVMLKDGMTRPAEAEMIDDPQLWERVPPIRVRKTVPDCWIKVTISEGRNRQVRRMCAAVDLPCLRLVRWSVGQWSLDGLAPGEWREVER